MRKLLVVAVGCLALAGCGQRPGAGSAEPPVGTAPPTSATSSAPTSATTPTSRPTSRPTSGPTPTSALEVPVPPKLSPQAESALTRAVAQGARTVALTVSTEVGQVEGVASALRALGATVESSDAAIGYVRATVPVDEVGRVPSVEGVRQVDVDEPLSNGDPTP